jgi:methylthioribulose-1-phosphate dehydratase
MAPSGVEKEKLTPGDFFEFNLDFNPILSPDRKLTECFPIFKTIYQMRGAYGVVHSHHISSVMASIIANSKPVNNEIVLSGFEMLKGISGHKNTDKLVIPIIENTERESELTERIKYCLTIYPKTFAIVVRNHGVYIWGNSIIQTKLHSETYHYLLDLYTKLYPVKYTDNSLLPCMWIVDNIQVKEDTNRVSDNLDREWLDRNGVEYFFSNDENDVNDICKKYNIITSDIIKITGDLDTTKFFNNHYHQEYELRYILEGSGYFDILDKLTNKWFRIQVIPGSLLYIPAGQIHRYTTDIHKYTVAKRLFSTDEPIWTPISV